MNLDFTDHKGIKSKIRFLKTPQDVDITNMPMVINQREIRKTAVGGEAVRKMLE